MQTPQYLTRPKNIGRLYGTLRYDKERDKYIAKVEESALELARRVFPGSDAKDLDEGELAFPATKRYVADLNWFMLRFPLAIDSTATRRLKKDRDLAIAHALRREELTTPERVPIPNSVKTPLFDYQEEGVQFLLANEACVLADETGTGKSLVALAAAAAGKVWPLLIIAERPRMARQWAAYVKQYLNVETRPGQRPVHVIEGLKPYELPDTPIHVIHYGLLRGWRDVIPQQGYAGVVLDEVQELRHTGTEKYSVASLVTSECRYRWGLSATPIYGYGAEIWNVMNAIEYHCLGDFDAFTRDRCTGYGEKIVKDPEGLGAYLRREGLMLRRTWNDPRIAGRALPVNRVIHKIGHDHEKYASLLQTAIGYAYEYEGTTDWHTRGKLARAIGEETRKATGEAKAPFVAAFARALLDAGESVLLCAHHHDVHNELTEALRAYNPVRATGMESPTKQQQSVERFADGETKLIQLALRSVAGLDKLQAQGTCLVFGELDWSPAVMTQAEGRLRRVGGRRDITNIMSYYLVTDTGTDETMQEALGLKVGQFLGIMGDAPETEDARLLNQRVAENHLGKIIDHLKTLGPRPPHADELPILAQQAARWF